MAEWQDESNEAKIAPQLEKVFSSVTLDPGEFSQATSQWSESDWVRFAELAAVRLDLFNGYDDILWVKTADLSLAESSREKFAAACFAFSLKSNSPSDFWTRVKSLPQSEMIRKNILLDNLKFESESPSNDIPWWLYNTPIIEVLEQLVQNHAELSPHLRKVLSRTQPLIDSSDESVEALHQRLEILSTAP